MYGILSIRAEYPLNGPVFARHWVKNADQEPVLFLDIDRATVMAEGMNNALLEEGITDHKYRARFFDSDYK